MQRLIDPNATWQDIAHKVRLLDDECCHLQRQTKLLQKVNEAQRARIDELARMYRRALTAAAALAVAAAVSMIAHT